METEEALALLIDDREFGVLNDRLARFNLFEALGSVRGELRHSNFLAFLLSPARSHGLGAKFLQPFLRAVLSKIPSENRPVRALEVVVGDLDDAVVFREVDYIDVLIEIRELNLLVVIENKVDADEGRGQLARYKDIVEKKYPQWRKLFVFLTPEGREAENHDYVSFSYVELVRIVDALVEEGRSIYGDDVLLLLKHYAEMLRRNIVDDEALRSLALKLYERHAGAIDFIIKCKPEEKSLLPSAQVLVEANSALLADKHSSTIYRFYPKEWAGVRSLESCPMDRWSKSGRNLLFEIKSFKSEGEYLDRILLSLVLGPSELTLRQHLFEKIRARPDVFVNAGKTIGQSWVTVYSRELLSAALAETMDDQQKRNTIARNWDEFCTQNLPQLTNAVLEIGIKVPDPISP